MHSQTARASEAHDAGVRTRGLLTVFGATLVHGPSMIEKFARIGTPDLSDAAVRHTRRVTQIWCVLFAANSLFSLYTALYWQREAWSLYNGVISYGLIRALLAGEFAWRHLVMLPRAACGGEMIALHDLLCADGDALGVPRVRTTPRAMVS